ncbi:MAG TPA: DNA-3-methyladenine glycosylase [Actinomycetota bacterium]|nr:DNA-3-methyladenine glycosylase [Actinomycetota bacterium]
MRLGRRLPRSFFARPPVEVAPDLLGRVLVRVPPGGGRLAARIVETEAYEERDPASHSYRGRTPRTEVMFGPPGRLYVYFTYGMHFCMNVVVGREGEGAAVLLRAAEPLEGLAEMAERRGTTDVGRLCSGPARLAQAFGVERAANGLDVVRGREMWLLEGQAASPAAIVRTARVGVRVGTERTWRYLVRGDPFVSPGRPARVTG